MSDFLELLAADVADSSGASGMLGAPDSSDSIHSRIAALAQEAGTTINGYIKQALENQLKLAH